MRFGGFELDVRSRMLFHGGRPVAVRPREFDLLVLLARCAGSLVTKDEIVSSVWCGSAVSDAALTQCVYRLRRTLAEYEPGVSHISAIPGRGYQFVVSAYPLEPPA